MTSQPPGVPQQQPDEWQLPPESPAGDSVDNFRADAGAARPKPLPELVVSMGQPSSGRFTAVLLGLLGLLVVVMPLRALFTPGFDRVGLVVMTLMFSVWTVFCWLLAINSWTMGHARISADAEGISGRSGSAFWSIPWNQIAVISIHSQTPRQMFSRRVHITPKPGAQVSQHNAWQVRHPSSPRGTFGGVLDSDETSRALRRLAHAHGLDSDPKSRRQLRVQR